MLDKLLSSLSGMGSFMSVMGWVQNLMVHFAKDIQDESARDAAIDSVIEVLEAHKSTAPKD